MAKVKTQYVCTNCDKVEYSWMGQCLSCNEWNTFEEKLVSKSSAGSLVSGKAVLSKTVRKISELGSQEKTNFRIKNFSYEIDRVLGGGFFKGGLYLFGGEPGIGKSTLCLEILKFLNNNYKSLYLAGEESVEQIASRSNRLGTKLDNVDFLESMYIEHILTQLEKTKYNVLIIDSIQVLKSLDPGMSKTSNYRLICETLIEKVKPLGVTCILIGHVTKEGEIAGPKMLEHMVDVVLYLEGDRVSPYRFLKSVKNRFGPTNEVGIFKMDSSGLKPVEDATKEFLEDHETSVIGAALGCMLSESRPIIVEIQALCVRSNFGYPKRSTVGFDLNRLNMLLAVLQKYHGVDLSEFDVYVNVTGGLKIKDTGCDLSLMMALKSSFSKQANKFDTIFMGECSLTGKIKPAFLFEDRSKEMKRLGYKVISNFN